VLKDISKKLTMKKTFFTTQLEGFFNSITQEYQTLIHELEVEKRVVEERVSKLEKDVENLVEIKKSLEKTNQIDQRRIKELQESLASSRHLGSNAYVETLQEENEQLKNEIQTLKNNQADNEEVEALKEKVQKLQGYISKGANAYNDNLMSETKESIIKEISESLKK
jgi:predicted RNase H-like nuclease (RuvC/YqgF family)